MTKFGADVPVASGEVPFQVSVVAFCDLCMYAVFGPAFSAEAESFVFRFQRMVYHSMVLIDSVVEFVAFVSKYGDIFADVAVQ